MRSKAPTLTGDALRAVKHRGSHVQIIASAGSGRTEVISQRIASLLAEDVPAEAIVAFTFTEKAAASLKARIHARAAERLGEDALGRLAPLYVGTIHAYCFRLLQQYVPRFEAYDVLDENRLAAFLARESKPLEIKSLDGKLSASMRTFLANLEVVENELDQAIYQWRGTDVRNIVEFTKRNRKAATFTIATNRRSRPEIIKLANRCSRKIEGRLPKEMKRDRSAGEHEVVTWKAPTETAQAETIARHIKAARRRGYAFRDMAVLIRGRTSLGAILTALDAEGIPIQPGGRTNLFLQPDAQQFGRLCAWLVDHDWRPDGYGAGEPVTLNGLVAAYVRDLGLSASRRAAVRRRLLALKEQVEAPTERANLVRDFYELLHDLGVAEWDFDDPRAASRVGACWRAAHRSSPTTRASGDAPAWIQTVQARSSAAKTAASGTTGGWRSSSRTGRRARTRTSTARTRSISTPSRSPPSIRPRASSGRSSSCPH